MNFKKMKTALNVSIIIFVTIVVTRICWTAFAVYSFSNIYSDKQADVAIVMGAATNGGKISPVFQERVNESIKLLKSQKVEYIIITGGYGENQNLSDSKVAKLYAQEKGISEEKILIEEVSTTSYENLVEAKKLMESNKFKTALLVSDPYHMLRSIRISKKLNINVKSTPTRTSMYRTSRTKRKALIYEAFFFQIDLILGHL